MAEPGDVSVIIPAFNEEEGIAAVVAAVLARRPWREVLVVDDGSTDRTAERAAGAGARVVRHPYNKGNGAAVKTGVREARGEVVLLMDGDGQTIRRKPFRRSPWAPRHGDRARRQGEQTSSARSATVLNATPRGSQKADPDITGFRAARRDRLLDVIHLLPNGFSYPTTSCLAFLKAGFNVLFVPITARPRVGRSKIRVMRDGVRFLLIILKIVTLYSPMKVFFPISAASLLVGIAYGIWNVMRYDKIPMGSALLIQLGVVVFLFGLISEQIASGQDRK